ncbi:hypothetical protein G6F42_022371 [Rhizopus arrhizus]|nr:hypothetical protein G6F42_022371 [Rhizopus arrhizus]
MEPQLQPHPAATKVIDFMDWSCSTTENLEISLVRPRQGDSNSNEPTTSTTFQPEFTYPIFGDHETAFGYKDLSLKAHCDLLYQWNIQQNINQQALPHP